MFNRYRLPLVTAKEGDSTLADYMEHLAACTNNPVRDKVESIGVETL